MATFTIIATITIEGSRIKSKKDATNELVVMLGDYEGNNSDGMAGITIHVDSVTKEKDSPAYETEGCPFCGSLNTTENKCNECGRYFCEDDRIIEPIRHKLSALCSREDATEEHPYHCNIPIGWLRPYDGPYVDEPHVIGIFEDEDIVCFIIKELNEPWELDALPTSDIVKIAEELNL